MNIKKRRISNFELLRIIAMFMIVSSHLVFHGVTQNNINSWMQGSWINKIFSTLFQPGGRVGVAIFFMITGYFLHKRKNIRVKKVIIEGYFYGIFQFLLFIIILFFKKQYTVGINKKEVIEGAVIPFSGSTTNWWFLGAYVALMFLIPSLNFLIKKYNCNKVLCCFWVVYLLMRTFASPFVTIAQASFYYILGVFLYENRIFQNKKIKNLILFVITWMFCGAIELLKELTAVQNALLPHENFIIKIMSFLESGILVPLCAIVFFRFITSFDITSIKINKLASCMFGVYLLSDGGYTRILLWKYLLNIVAQYKNTLFPLLVLLDLMIVFVLGILIDIVRQKITFKLHNYANE